MALDGLEQATKNSLISLMDMLGGDVEEQKHTKSMIVSTIEGMIKKLMAEQAKHKADKATDLDGYECIDDEESATNRAIGIYNYYLNLK